MAHKLLCIEIHANRNRPAESAKRYQQPCASANILLPCLWILPLQRSQRRPPRQAQQTPRRRQMLLRRCRNTTRTSRTHQPRKRGPFGEGRDQQTATAARLHSSLIETDATYLHSPMTSRGWSRSRLSESSENRPSYVAILRDTIMREHPRFIRKISPSETSACC